MPRLLIVDDDPLVCATLRAAAERWGHDATIRTDARGAMEAYDRNEYDLVLSDLWLPGVSGLELLRRIRKIDPDTPVVVMSEAASTSSIVAAMRAGAVDFVQKTGNEGLRIEELELVVERTLRQLSRGEADAPGSAAGGEDRYEEMVGGSRAMRRLYAVVEQVAPQDVTILVYGESGTGKELCARALHARSGRAANRMQIVNCAAFHETLLASELFGHEQGAFTGATQARVGHFEVASGGTLFLDEIGEAPPSVQAMLLRVLQEHEIVRVGGTEPIKVDVRVLAATNRDLSDEVQKGGFRGDLYYRLATFPIEVPPLRDREGDIPLLVDHFLGRAPGGRPRIDAPALAALISHDWPGNVRELRNVLTRASILSGGGAISYAHVADALSVMDQSRARENALDERLIRSPAAGNGAGLSDDVYTLQLRGAREAFDRAYLGRLLERAGGNCTRAARLAGIGRASLYAKLRKLGVNPEQFREDSVADGARVTG